MRPRGRLVVLLAALLGAGACSTDVDPSGVVASGTLVVRADVGGWWLPGTRFVASGPSGSLTLLSRDDGLAVAVGVVPGPWTVRVDEIDGDARLDSAVVEVVVRSESADTAVFTGDFDPGRFVDVAVGNAVICGLNEAGNVYCFGLGEFGELGTGEPARSARPVRARTPEPMVSVTAGSLHMCGVGESGAGWCWGLNAAGRLGAGIPGDEQPFIALPTPVAGGLRFSTIAAGISFACALEAGTGRAWCWGSASIGQLGNGARSGASLVPIPVDTEERFVSLQVKESWAGTRSVAARTADGRVFVWGASPDGEPSWLAFSGARPVEVPLPGPARAATPVCALLDADVLCWPRLPDNTPPEVLSVLPPTASEGLREYLTDTLDPTFFEGGFHCRPAPGGYACTDAWAYPLPLLDFEGEAAVAVEAFGRGGCAATDAGRLWCWQGDLFRAVQRAGPGAG